MDNSIDAIITRTRQSYYSDGLWELFAGSVLLIGGAILLSSLDGNAGAVLFSFGILILFFLYLWIKNRFIYPRSGFAVYKEQELFARLFRIFKRALFLSILLGIYLLLHSPIQLVEDRWLVLVIGIFIGSGWIWQGLKLSLTRLTLLGITSLLLGALLSPLLPLVPSMGINSLRILGLYFLLVGIAFLVSGAFTLAGYLRAEGMWQ
jgi:hypothetical protein